ncbi:hypothetical protein [Pseudoduganella lutea]|uniref:Uncharacterized protein n=1 Tax=Pseudoduganella lutea TaxID=321985 RepID=A0A4V0Z489_9BURK|nr:hypothetical protein [Pseudoduganella lutea]QBE66103.1 hypothetical protein EWM63_26550 [Pseudoduganella lutea]
MRGALAGIVTGAIAGILEAQFREQMLSSLEHLPQPVADKRGVEQYLKDPNVKAAMRTLDLLDRDLAPFVYDLKQHNIVIRTHVSGEFMLLGPTTMGPEERLAFSSGLVDELVAYETDLITIQENLDAALAREPKALVAAKSAQELFALVDTRLVEELLFRNGFAVEDIAGIRGSLQSFQSRVRSAFAQVRAAKADIDAIVADAGTTLFFARRLYGDILAEMVRARMQERFIEP